jgi:hypothetical protein
MKIDQERLHANLISSKIHDIFLHRDRYTIPLWEHFIKKQDLGIVCTFENQKGLFLYQITDERKWMLTKIKYGI